MILAIFILIGCDFAGDWLRAILHLPIPGAVLGMLLLAAGLALRGGEADASRSPSPLDRTADALLANMGLLFVPAGTGILAQADLLRGEWRPVAIAVIGSTLVGLAVTALVMHRFGRVQAESLPPALTPEGAAS
ncbi:CidA/LrgA family protein [Labrys monachus]|uniref:Effector of murein hydrolase LrgA (UPF0299 family) n=1 Tax=Labrys monachus TaxID=217067 RepID=A0ABU0FCN2_9HYPH|nr:CidA/LrgA family protein [Labrys monachus]MDQ0392362.1 putative effector of murein hydrolase LrgA (UPF0299 family) [Labrys monachus]